MVRSFKDLVDEANTVSVDGWDFSWLKDRATEERPSWGYQKLMSERLAGASAALDIQTGGGEVLAGAATFPPAMAATESWPPNVAKATELLHPRGVIVVADPDEPPLPFADAAFDLVTSRHPATVWWTEIARVLKPGGTYFAQHVGPETVFALIEVFLGPLSDEPRRKRHPDEETAAARAVRRALDTCPHRGPETRLSELPARCPMVDRAAESFPSGWFIGQSGDDRGLEFLMPTFVLVTAFVGSWRGSLRSWPGQARLPTTDKGAIAVRDAAELGRRRQGVGAHTLPNTCVTCGASRPNKSRRLRGRKLRTCSTRTNRRELAEPDEG